MVWTFFENSDEGVYVEVLVANRLGFNGIGYIFTWSLIAEPFN